MNSYLLTHVGIIRIFPKKQAIYQSSTLSSINLFFVGVSNSPLGFNPCDFWNFFNAMIVGPAMTPVFFPWKNPVFERSHWSASTLSPRSPLCGKPIALIRFSTIFIFSSQRECSEMRSFLFSSMSFNSTSCIDWNFPCWLASEARVFGPNVHAPSSLRSLMISWSSWYCMIIDFTSSFSTIYPRSVKAAMTSSDITHTAELFTVL